MRKYVMDLEANGLLDSVSQIYHVVLKPIGQEEFIVFSDIDEGAQPLAECGSWIDENVDLLVAHNGVRYDLEVMYRILNWEPKCKVHDTMIMSKLLNFVRPETNRKHSLKAWGELLGESKDDYSHGFDEWHPEMLPYCKQDCIVTEKVYERLLQEVAGKLHALKDDDRKARFKLALQTEHSLAKLSAQQTRDGWLFDFDRCEILIEEITDKMLEIEEEVEPHLSDIVRDIDKEPKTPKYKQDGTYTVASARVISDYVGYVVSPEDALKAKPPVEPGQEFKRTEIVPASLGNQDVVKEYLESLGWEPDEWNWKKVNGQFIRMAPKFTEKSLKKVGHAHADMINQYYMLRQRRSIMQGWMEQKDGDGRLRGDVNDMGAASFRQTHRVMVNIPSGKAEYGKEIRELFIVPPGKTIISADGAAYQIRILSHYLKSDEYTDVVLNGDPHQMHADKIGCTRNEAKGVFFGVLFGAGAAKVGNMLGISQKAGGEKRRALLNGIPGMNNLLNKLKNFASQTGWVPGIDGRQVYPEQEYKALNYLVQSCEAILMKRTVVRVAELFKENNIEFKQLLFYHDECSWEIDPKDTELATKLIKEAFETAPKDYGVDIMEAGDIVTGGNYYEVH